MSLHSVFDGARRLVPFFLLFPLLLSCDSGPTGPGKSEIGEAGGKASLADGAVVLTIPADALSGTITLTATQPSSYPDSDLLVDGSIFEIGPAGTLFARLVTMTLSYDPANLPEGVREEELRLFQVSGGRWVEALNSSVDTDAHEVTGRIDGLGLFGARGLSVAMVNLSPNFYALEEGGTKTLTAVGKSATGVTLPDRTVTWTSGDDAIATVDADGVVTGVGMGSVTITATVEGVSLSAEITAWSCSQQSQIPEAECQALVDFFDDANLEEWRYTAAWMPSPQPCYWRGVTCEGTSVSRLYFFVGDMNGSLPFSLGDLGGLKELSLGSCGLTGQLPPTIGNLSNLEVLSLSGNGLSGPIPSEIGQLTKLRTLNLFGNEFSGSIPPEMGDLSSLTEMSLNGNQLSGSIPPELGRLTNLTRLTLLDNPLSGSIPPELGDLSSLEHLSIGVSDLSGSIPAELGNLSNLKVLGISRTQISGSIPAELGNLANLEALALWGNELSGTVPLSVAQLGGIIQARDGGGPNCVLVPTGNEGLSMPDTQEYRDADLNGDGRICGVTLGG